MCNIKIFTLQKWPYTGQFWAKALSVNLPCPSRGWQQGAVCVHGETTAHTWPRGAAREHWWVAWWSGPDPHYSSSLHSQTPPPESPESEPGQATKKLLYLQTAVFVLNNSVNKKSATFRLFHVAHDSIFTISWSVISTVLSWVCSSLRACWARLLLPTAESCWKLVCMASIRKLNRSSTRAAVDDVAWTTRTGNGQKVQPPKHTKVSY